MIRPLAASLIVASLGLTIARAEPATGPTTLPVTISGGHETDPRDNGRPVALVAGALGVPAQTFRDAFSRVHPARGGGGPTPDEARANKKALMDVLAPLGVTNDRLDEVSNYYRYRRDRGELWPTTPAEAYATIVNGKPTITIVRGGSGYTSPPSVSIPSMPGAKLVATLKFDKDFAKNGSIGAIDVKR